ncbi:hypothetical protein Tco_0749167 [Tanacetum coccineum]|uniref:Uncharacterized protein n=1 Tax=Tanacetum coccineum TaxID=301880 RepID=A0ABQ4YYN2_9ASTR
MESRAKEEQKEARAQAEDVQRVVTRRREGRIRNRRQESEGGRAIGRAQENGDDPRSARRAKSSDKGVRARGEKRQRLAPEQESSREEDRESRRRQRRRARTGKEKTRRGSERAAIETAGHGGEECRATSSTRRRRKSASRVDVDQTSSTRVDEKDGRKARDQDRPARGVGRVERTTRNQRNRNARGLGVRGRVREQPVPQARRDGRTGAGEETLRNVSARKRTHRAIEKRRIARTSGGSRAQAAGRRQRGKKPEKHKGGKK